MENKKFIVETNKGIFTDEAIEKMRLILGSHFKGLYTFFCNYFFKFDENTYTIMLVRRCSVLATWFLKLIYKKLQTAIDENFEINLTDGLFSIVNKKTKKQNIIINDMFVESDYEFDKDYQIVVLDDICIHGRHIEHIRKKILKKFSVDRKINCKKIVYMRSTDSVFERIDWSWVDIGGIEWKRLSNQMVDCINYLNLPYVSYLNSMLKFNVKQDEFEAIISQLQKNDNLIVQEFNSSEKARIGKTSIVVLEKNYKSFDYERAKCFRIYYNKSTKVLSFIPYVIIAPIEYENIKNKFLDYSDSFGDIVNESKRNKFLYRLLNCVASNCYGNYFIDKYIGNIDYEEDYYNTLLFSFGISVKDKILAKSDLYVENLNRFGADKEIKTEEVDDLIDGLENDRFVDSILAKQWIQNEKNACYLMDKEEKIKIEPIIAKRSKRVLWDRIISIIGRCDMGMACISIDDRENDKYIESRLDVGELGINLMSDDDLFDIDDLDSIKTLKKASGYYRDIFF